MDIKNIDDNNISDSINFLESDIKDYNYNEKKQLIKRITDIKNKKCYIKIFKLIHNDNFNYTKNENGIFFNLSNMSDKIITKIDNILLFYEKKKYINDKKSTKLNIDSYNISSNIFTDDEIINQKYDY